MVSRNRWKKSAIGATTVTLIPSTKGGGPSPSYIAPTQIVITYPSTPPVDLWGTTTTDGVEYEETIFRTSV
jgi:hypothetical protein